MEYTIHYFPDQGLVDLDAEISKSEKKLDLALLNADKLQKLQAQAGYEQSIPDDVRASNAEKVSKIVHCLLVDVIELSPFRSCKRWK